MAKLEAEFESRVAAPEGREGRAGDRPGARAIDRLREALRDAERTRESVWGGDAAAVSGVDVPPETQETFEGLLEFLAGKRELDATASACLPGTFADRYGDDAGGDDARQRRADGSVVEDVEEVYAVAERARPAFGALLRLVASLAGVDPDEAVVLPDGAPVLDRGGAPTPRVVLAPLKRRARSRQKVVDDYRGDASRLRDVVRGSIVVDDEDALVRVAEAVRTVGGAFPILRFKNRFRRPPFNGYRDALYTLGVPAPPLLPDGRPPLLPSGDAAVHLHLCELQLHLTPLVALKQRTHVHYASFRTMFHGTADAADERLRVARTIRDRLPENATSLWALIINTVADADAGRSDAELLTALGERGLLGALLGRFDLAAHVLAAVGRAASASKDAPAELEALEALGRCHAAAFDFPRCERVVGAALARRLEARPSPSLDERTLDLLFLYSTARMCQGRMSTVDGVILETLAGQTELLGADHPSTLKTLDLHALVLSHRLRTIESDAIFHRAYHALKATRGKDHIDTLECHTRLAWNLYVMGRYDRAAAALESILEASVKAFGPQHTMTLKVVSFLALLQRALPGGWTPAHEKDLRSRVRDAGPKTCLAAFDALTCLMDTMAANNDDLRRLLDERHAFQHHETNAAIARTLVDETSDHLE